MFAKRKHDDKFIMVALDIAIFEEVLRILKQEYLITTLGYIRPKIEYREAYGDIIGPVSVSMGVVKAQDYTHLTQMNDACNSLCS